MHEKVGQKVLSPSYWKLVLSLAVLEECTRWAGTECNNELLAQPNLETDHL